MSLFSQMVVLANLFTKKTSAPNGDENALVVRNIPSGVQAVSITSEISGTPRNYYNEALSVAINATQTILSHTTAVGKTEQLNNIDMSGTNIATYDVFLNGTQLGRKRTYFGGPFDAVMSFGTGGPKMQAGDLLEVKVTNFRPMIGDFECRVQLLEV